MEFIIYLEIWYITTVVQKPEEEEMEVYSSYATRSGIISFEGRWWWVRSQSNYWNNTTKIIANKLF
jgi:hypothetical protein